MSELLSLVEGLTGNVSGKCARVADQVEGEWSCIGSVITVNSSDNNGKVSSAIYEVRDVFSVEVFCSSPSSSAGGSSSQHWALVVVLLFFCSVLEKVFELATFSVSPSLTGYNMLSVVSLPYMMYMMKIFICDEFMFLY